MNELTAEACGHAPCEKKEFLDMSSYNHASVQANLAFLLKRLGKYSVLVELTLDPEESSEVKPDVCIYPKRGLSRPRDVLRMKEMPLLAIEIISPEQGTDDILEKFEIYFKTGVKSCWLADPAMEIVAVYDSLAHHQVYSKGEAVDANLNIRLPVAEIFE